MINTTKIQREKLLSIIKLNNHYVTAYTEFCAISESLMNKIIISIFITKDKKLLQPTQILLKEINFKKRANVFKKISKIYFKDFDVELITSLEKIYILRNKIAHSYFITDKKFTDNLDKWKNRFPYRNMDDVKGQPYFLNISDAKKDIDQLGVINQKLTELLKSLKSPIPTESVTKIKYPVD